MKEKILVTGSAGFIGSAIAKKLIEKHYDVYGIDNLSTGKKSNLPRKIKFIKGNCEDNKILNKIKSIKFQIIIHFAGQSSGEMSFYNPIKDLNSNLVFLISFVFSLSSELFLVLSSVIISATSSPSSSEAISTKLLFETRA